MKHPDGAFLVDKPEGMSSFGVVNRFKGALRKNLGVTRGRDLPKIGHGGTLDPFATGLLVVLIGQGVKLARYYLGSQKTYEYTMRFGVGNAAGDRTEPVTESTDFLPASIDEIRRVASEMASATYSQTPPMHSAKKKDGKRLYELARKGIEIEREAVDCTLHELDILSYDPPIARGRVRCSAGTYVRTLAQDLAARLGSLALLDELRRTASGSFRLNSAMTLESIANELEKGTPAHELPCWVPISRLIDGMPAAEASLAEARSLIHGKQDDLEHIAGRARVRANSLGNSRLDSNVAIFYGEQLVAIAKQTQGSWELERVFADALVSQSQDIAN